MNPKRLRLISFFLAAALAQFACNAQAGGFSTPDTFATLNALYTASVLTQQSGGAPQPAQSVTPAPPPTPTAIPFFDTATSTPLPTVPQTRCDAAEFVSDVSYPDGSVVSRGSSFVKVWRIRNVGSCSWTPSYALVFTGGDLMNGPLTAALPGNVNPGETIDLKIAFTAPNKNGGYRGYWKLRNASGVLFGIGAQADTAFWVDVKVTGPSYTAYDFAANYCAAEWENKNSALPCPGKMDAPKGFVLRLDAPVLENGKTQSDPALLVFPQDKNDGIIKGQFPNFAVQAGDRFRAAVSCQFGAKKCNVVFRLDYKYNGQVKTLGTWYEAYEGLSYSIDLDLSALAGKKVKFILFVGANGANNDDYALWLNPRIERQGAAPAPTSTSTFTPVAPSATPVTPSATPITPSATPITPSATPITPTLTFTPETPTETATP